MDMPEPERTDEYVWHFKLGPGDEAPGDDALTEMVRRQLSALLRCVRLTSGGRDVSVTGFRFLDDPTREHQLSLMLREEPSGEAE